MLLGWGGGGRGGDEVLDAATEGRDVPERERPLVKKVPRTDPGSSETLFECEKSHLSKWSYSTLWLSYTCRYVQATTNNECFHESNEY